MCLGIGRWNMENDTLLNLISAICNTIADTEKKNIKNNELKAFTNKFQSLLEDAKKIINKSQKCFNKNEFHSFIGVNSLYATDIDKLFSDYICKDLKKRIGE